ncbi:MAG: VanZ family protein [Burkholderiales bacterium]|nr:VanZ family protein [Burkholderiales bacterium]
MAPLPRHRSSATLLAWVYGALICYASLYPFSGWRWPPGQGPMALARLPWTNWNLPFDIWINLLGYAPFGLLLIVAALRGGLRGPVAFAFATLLPCAISYAMECLQQFLPSRVPAMEDWTMNSVGALAGALLGWTGQSLGLIGRWQTTRTRWFVADSAGALTLLALWPVAQLFPAPVPLGLGQVGERLRSALADLVADVPWATALQQMLEVPAVPPAPLRPLSEALVVACGLLAPCLLAFSVMRPGWRRAVMAVGALALGCGAMTLSTLLNFGPAHALAWLTAIDAAGLLLGLLMALALVPLPTRVVVGVALVALTALAVGVAQAPADPYFSQSLLGWEQGRFIRFHGLAQWVGWIWPYVTMGWLLGRLGRREH